MNPTWAGTLFELGSRVALNNATDRKVFVSALLPTRAFAAVLIALGAVLSRPPDVTEAAQAWKLELSPGTPCWFPIGGKFTKCAIEGLTGNPDLPVRVLTMHNIPGLDAGARVSVPPRMLSRLLPISCEEGHASKRMGVRGLDTLVKLIGEEQSYAFYGEKTLQAMICGVASDIHEECKELDIEVCGATISALQVLRPRSFVGEKAGYHSDVVTALQRPRAVPGESPDLVVFDGAYAYLQWWRVWKDVPAIVVLDNSSASRARLSEVMRRAHGFRERGRFLNDLLPECPAQMEVLAVSH